MSGQARRSRRHAVVLDAPPEAKDGGRTMTEGVEDRDLIARIASGDEAAMRTLFLRYRQRVAGFIRRVLNNEALVEELANEVFLEIWRGARNFQGRSAVTTWILSIAHYRALNVLKKRGEDALDDDDAWQIPDTRDTPEVVLQKADKAQALRACAEELTPLQREIIDLVYYRELSIKEVSEVLGIPDNTVKTRLFKARKRLEKIMEQAGVDRGWP